MSIYDIDGNIIVNTKILMPNISVNVDYGRENNTSYYFIRIPKNTIDGKKISPKVGLTSPDMLYANSVSAFDWASVNDSILSVNAGLFKTNLNPMGVLVINGVGYTTDPFTSADGVNRYPLCIDNDGNLSAPYTDRLTSNNTVINDGYKYAVSAWGTPIINYAVAASSVFDETVHAGEHMPQQVIGQFQNGDYFVFTCEGPRGSIQNETGMTYEEIEAILVSKGVKFAYALDGGGSAETVIGKRQINNVYENETGRKVPTVIYFSVDS